MNYLRQHSSHWRQNEQISLFKWLVKIFTSLTLRVMLLLHRLHNHIFTYFQWTIEPGSRVLWWQNIKADVKVLLRDFATNHDKCYQHWSLIFPVRYLTKISKSRWLNQVSFKTFLGSTWRTSLANDQHHLFLDMWSISCTVRASQCCTNWHNYYNLYWKTNRISIQVFYPLVWNWRDNC